MLPGDIEYVFELDRYTQTVVCTRATEVYHLEAVHFDKLFGRRSPRTLARLRATVIDKLRCRSSSRRRGSDVLLYRLLLQRAGRAGEGRAQSPSPPAPLPPPQKEASTPATTAEKISDKNLMFEQLVTLFLENRAPLIRPMVAGSVYYRVKSMERARRPAATRRPRRGREARHRRPTTDTLTALTPEVSEQRLRSAPRAKPARSRRTLERITSSGDMADEQNGRYDDGYAVRPHTASGVRMRQSVTSRRPSSAASLPERRIFQLTQSSPGANDADDNDEDDEDGALRGIIANIGEMQQAQHASRSKVVCSMYERRANQKTALLPTAMVTWGRDVAEEGEGEGEEGGVAFDWETSESALTELERKLREFHWRQDECGDKVTPQIAELKRFAIEVRRRPVTRYKRVGGGAYGRACDSNVQ